MGTSDLLDLRDGPALPVMEAFAEARRRLAVQWLGLPLAAARHHWADELGRLHRLVESSGIRDQFLTQPDVPIVRRLAKILSQPRTQDIGTLLAAMLYYYPHQLPTVFPLEAIPDWLADAYLRYMQAAPPLLRDVGEAEVYTRSLNAWLGYLHEKIAAEPNNPAWRQVGLSVSQSTNVMMAYFSSANIRELMIRRARLLENTLAAMGNVLDFQFGPRPARTKIRLGVLAAHFSPQTETFATLPAYRYLDRSKFEIVLFALQVSGHPLEQLCRSLADQFVALPQLLPQQVQMIRNANLDMLLLATNVTAITNGITLLAVHRLARVQVATVCSCVTTGMRNVDWYLSGRMSEPASAAQDHYTEHLLLIDGPAHCYDFGTEKPPEVVLSFARRDLGLDSGGVIFASGANFYKILPELDEVWARILAGVPGSRLLLYPFNPNWSDNYPERPFWQRLCGALARHGVAADRLLIFKQAPSRTHILQRLRLADVYLDSYPFAGATSLLDPLEVGLPAIEMDGNNFRSLVGSALLKDLHLDDFVVKNSQEYIDLAVRLGLDREFRATARKRFVDAMAMRPRFLDPRWYAAQVESVLLEAWQSNRPGMIQHPKP